MYISSISSSQYNRSFYGTKISQTLSSNLLSQTKKVPLNVKGKGCRFFGVDSHENIFSKLFNHASLARIMERDKGIKAAFRGLNFLNVEDAQNLRANKEKLWVGYKPLGAKTNAWAQGITVLRAAGAARMNIYSPTLFGDSVHTIGLVVDNKTNTLYVLDSFGNTGVVRGYHDKITKLFDGKKYCSMKEIHAPEPFSRIIFSKKQQQTFNEYTCNNWTFANIESLVSALRSGKIINNDRELDKYLSDDINKILETQRRYVIKNRDFFDR